MNSIMKTTDKGTKLWVIPNTENDKLSHYDYGILHREDGPALEWGDGNKSWFINGKTHREDGPAIEYSDGTKFWYLNGRRHRKDGPAIEWKDNTISWRLNNKLIEPTLKMMEKYIRLNPDNISKYWEYPLKIQLLAIKLKPSVIFNIKYPHKKLKELYPKLYVLKDSGLI